MKATKITKNASQPNLPNNKLSQKKSLAIFAFEIL